MTPLSDSSSIAAAIDTSGLGERLDVAVARGVLGAGLAHRALLAARLTHTLPRAGAGTLPAAASGEELGLTLGLSRAAVHKHVDHLRSLGFAVESVPGEGYRLIRPFTDLVAAEAVLPFLLQAARPETSWTAGLPYLYRSRCESTNLGLKEAMAAGPETLAAGALMVADQQTGGRGRLGRVWSSEPGKDLTFSVLLRPSLAPAQAHLLSLAAALAVAEVLETLPDLGFPSLSGRVAVKWPNDVLVGDEKVCGILLEGSMDDDRLQWAVAGIGMNVNSSPAAMLKGLTPGQAEAWAGRPGPASLRERLGRDVPRAPLLAALLSRLTARWTELDEGDGPGPAGEPGPGGRAAAGVLWELRQRDALAGCQVEVLSGSRRQGRQDVVASGEAVGIGPEGQLLVQGASGDTVAVFAGDVTLRAVNLDPTAG
jgi:BirA family biotin operon repressor/biotin-[acetyl-CoA-carboxylase] ligase